ncbi:MAG: hypothetical protein ACYDDF_09635 [Thermoplasmatota archaeon]
MAPVAHAYDPCSPDSVTNQLGCQAWYSTFRVYLPGNNAGAAAGSFDPTAYNDVSGPAGQEEAVLPSSPDIPYQFVGLDNVLVKPALDNQVSGQPGDAPSWVQAWPGFDDNTWAVFDQKQVSDFGTGTGGVLPYGYLASPVIGQSWTTPGQQFIAYYGFFRDVNHDNVINADPTAATSCATPTFCSASDEFVWRGANDGEGTGTNYQLVGFQYVFPTNTQEGGPNVVYTGDRQVACAGSASLVFNCGPSSAWQDGPIIVGGVVLGAGLAGDCAKWAAEDTNCVSPAPEGVWADGTNDSKRPGQVWDMGAGPNGQTILTGSGGSTVTPEESLLISRYVVSVVGPHDLLLPTDPTGFSVNANPSTTGFFRAINWFQQLAPSSVGSLYTSSMHNARNTAIGTMDMTPSSDPVPALIDPIITPVTQPAEDTQSYGCVPETAATHCTVDTRQNVALANHAQVVPTNGGPGTSANPLAYAFFYSDAPVMSAPGKSWYAYWCAQANVDPGTCATVVGTAPGGSPSIEDPNYYAFYGETQQNGQHITGYTPSNYYVGVMETALLWYDNSQDGFIGQPDNYTIQQYNAGNFWTANTGCCGEANDGTSAPIDPTIDTISGLDNELRGATVTPQGTWPPGTFEALYDNSLPVNGNGLGPGTGAQLIPLTGSTPVFLRSALAAGNNFCQEHETDNSCPSADGLIIPTGTALGLHGSMPVTLTWSEGTPPNPSYTYSWSGTYSWNASL